MNKRVILFLTLCTLTTACNKDQNPAPAANFIDYGYTAPSTFTGAHQMIYYDGTIFAGTDDGIWKINLTEKAWKRAGLDGKKITCLYSHPAVAGKFFAGVASQGSTDKSLYISNDAGANWLTAQNPVFDSGNNRFETYYDIKARPGFPLQVFANLSGATIAVSRDGGITWNRQNYATDSYFGIDCSISFLENNPNVIYQGAEAPLDHAWLGKYPIDPDDPVMMGPLDQIIGKNYEWSNKRPNCIETFGSNPGVLYVGMEGAL
ncbi:MAG TPA: hypothetical protein VFO70_03355, partial [Chitinophagaceae bacterium]|nr:hypothetical protein [Chitinophagaceae bacterium]